MLCSISVYVTQHCLKPNQSVNLFNQIIKSMYQTPFCENNCPACCGCADLPDEKTKSIDDEIEELEDDNDLDRELEFFDEEYYNRINN